METRKMTSAEIEQKIRDIAVMWDKEEKQEEMRDISALTIKCDSKERRFYIYQRGREIARIPQDQEHVMREVFRDFQHTTIFCALRLLPLLSKHISKEGRKVEIWTVEGFSFAKILAKGK